MDYNYILLIFLFFHACQGGRIHVSQAALSHTGLDNNSDKVASSAGDGIENLEKPKCIIIGLPGLLETPKQFDKIFEALQLTLAAHYQVETYYIYSRPEQKFASLHERDQAFIEPVGVWHQEILPALRDPHILTIVLGHSLGARTAVQALQPNRYSAPFPNTLVILSSPAWNGSFWCYKGIINQYAALLKSNRLLKAILQFANFFHIDKIKFLVQALHEAEAPLFKDLTPQPNWLPQTTQQTLHETQLPILLLATQAKADYMAIIWKRCARYLLASPTPTPHAAASFEGSTQLIELSDYILHVLTHQETDGVIETAVQLTGYPPNIRINNIQTLLLAGLHESTLVRKEAHRAITKWVLEQLDDFPKSSTGK